MKRAQPPAPEPFSTHSLLWRLWVWTAGAVLLAGLLAGGVSYLFAWQESNELQDTQLQQIAALVVAGSVRPQALDRSLQGDVDQDARIVIQSLRADAPPGRLSLPRNLGTGFHTVVEPGGNTWRVFVQHTPRGAVAVAQRTDLRSDAAGDSALRSLLPMLALVPLLVLLVGWVVGRALRPLRLLAHGVDARGETDLQPLSENGVPREILPFVRSINRLLARLNASMEQQRRFVADAAHELRTPIAVLGMQVDNLKPLQLQPQARERIDALHQGLQRARAVVEQLLSLARSQGDQAVQLQTIDPAQIVREVIADLLPLAESRRIDLGLDSAQPLRIRTDPHQLYTLLRNATDNAVRYTPPGGRVDLRVRVENGPKPRAVIEVQDTGPGIPPDQLALVFEPFVRLPEAAGEGSGLGLSIIRQIATRLGGQVALENAKGGGLILRYSQPLKSAKSGQS